MEILIILSYRTESAAALEKTFLGGRGMDVGDASNILSTKVLKNSADTDLVTGMLPVHYQHVTSMLPAC